MKKYFLILVLLISNSLQADSIFGVYAGVQSWFYDYSGDIDSPFGIENLQNSFDFNNESSLSYFVAIEHALPLVPNFKLRQTNFSHSGRSNNTINNPLVETDIDLSHTDITLYYELLDNWVNLDLGLSALYFTGNSELASIKNIVRENYSEFIPALYTKAQFDLPITDLSASLTANIGTLTSNSVIDIELAASYKIGLGFNLEAGVRKQTVKFEDFNSVNVNTSATGVFAALNFHF